MIKYTYSACSRSGCCNAHLLFRLQDMLYQSLKFTNAIWVLAELKMQPGNSTLQVRVSVCVQRPCVKMAAANWYVFRSIFVDQTNESHHGKEFVRIKQSTKSRSCEDNSKISYR